MNLVKISTLPPGTEVRVHIGAQYPPIDYRLLYVNDCRAFVEPLGRQKRQVRDANQDLLAEFDAPTGGRVNIAPATEVEVLTVSDNDDLLGLPTPRANGKRAGVIHYEPQRAKRPMRPNTTRALMYEYVTDSLVGEPSVEAVMAHFKMKRTLVLAHLWEFWNSCGHGYTVDGDVITIVDPLQ